MMPAVTVAWNPNGEPIATAQSPTCTPSELPILAATRLALVDLDHRHIGRWIRADHLGVVFSGSPLNFTLTRVAFSTTWLLVRM